MVRLVGFFAGLLFVVVLFFAAFQPREAPIAVAHGLEPVEHEWSFSGVFGTFDQAQLQRGFQVYREVCSACHGMTLVAFRDLEAIGFSGAEVKAIAKSFEIASINPETGEPATRPGIPADRFPSPYPNEVAARAANNNAYPPDMSLLAKAREGGPDYIHSLVGLGYVEPPKGHEVPDGLYYNKFYANLNFGMPAPLSDGQVEYNDKTKATVEQMSLDVSAFLMWAAEPKLQARRETGLGVVVFLSIMAVLSWLTYRAVWADLKKKPGQLAQPAE